MVETKTEQQRMNNNAQPYITEQEYRREKPSQSENLFIIDAKEALSQKIVIIDTGCANVSSVKFAIERLGYRVMLSKEPSAILTADKLFLPGVGTATEAMKNLHHRHLVEVIEQVEKPLLGICLGMQILATLSQESGVEKNQAEQCTGSQKQSSFVKKEIACLDICQAEVRAMQTNGLPLPHMGWNTVSTVSKQSNGIEKLLLQSHPLFSQIKEDEYFYFVHSFAMPIGAYTIASCQYGTPFTAALQHNNYYGVQFHPERSGKAGARLIRNFLELNVK